MFSIALIGPDGCGKTTVANKIEQALPWPAKRVYMGVSLESSNVMLPTSRLKLALRRLAGRPSDTTGPRDHFKSERKPSGRLRGTFKFVKRSISFVNQVAEESFRQLIVAWHLFRGRVVLLDRDFFADYYAYDIIGNDRSVFRRLHGWLLVHVYRKPDLVIFLDVSGETMFARKGEGSIELLNRRCQDYRELQNVMPNFAIVNAERPLSTVVHDVQQHIGRLHLDQSQSRNRNELPTAVVIGADCVTGLQTARSLAHHKIPVLAIATNLNHFCCQTNVFQRILKCDASEPALIELLQTLGPAFSTKAVLFPCTDLAALQVSEHRHLIQSWYRFALPSHETILKMTDKLEFARHAQEFDIPFPQSRTLESLADAEEAARELTFPCYLKPAVKTKAWEEGTKQKAFVLHDATELIDTYRRCANWTDRLLVQEAIVGPTENHYTCDMYFGSDGKPAALFGSRKLRCWPLETGTGCLSVEEDCERLRAKALAVYRDVSFHGLAYVEFKRDSRTGEDLVIETNVGRPTGRSAASVRSGVDLLYTMYCDLVGLPTPSNRPKPAAGRKWVHLRRDFQAAAKLWNSGDLLLRQWRRSISGPKHFAVLSWRDPKPFVAEMKRYLGQLLFGRKA